MNIVKEWLKVSASDIKVIKKILDSEELSHIVAFHAQQSIEKSFKALIEFNGLNIPKQHDLLKLKSMLNNSIDADEDLLDTLNQLYIDSRYPGEMGLLPNGKPTLENAKEFYDFSVEIFTIVCEFVKIKKEELI